MNFIELNKNNIKDEHICCAFSDKKCAEGYELKKKWLSAQFVNNYVFKKLDARAKVFIEYVDAEFAWAPIEAPNYKFIDCFWVSGQYKGKGYAKSLIQDCINDSKDKSGIVAISSSKKQPFLSDRKFFEKQGFKLVDSSEPYFELWALKFDENALDPQIKDCAKSGICDVDDGLAVYYSDACPFTDYYVNKELADVAKKHGFRLTVKKIDNIEKAQNHFVPFTIFSLFKDSKFVTQQIQSANSFEKLFCK